MGDFAQDVNFRKNKIKNAKVDIPDRDNIEEDDAIDKKFVDDSLIYSTDLTADTSLQPSNEIFDRTLLHNKNIFEVFDEVFYKLIKASYIRPTMSLSLEFYQPGTTILVSSPEPGEVVDAIFTTSFSQNHSKGITGGVDYLQLSPSSFSQSNANVGAYTIPNYVVDVSSSWRASIDYQEANTLNDSRGNPDTSGLSTAPYFGPGTLTSTISRTIAWPYYAVVLDGDVPAPNAIQLNSTLSSGKVKSDLVGEIEIDIIAGGTKTIIFAVPISGVTMPQFQVTKDSSISVAASFTTSLLTSVPDVTNSGQLINYAVYRATNGNGFDLASKYQFKLI